MVGSRRISIIALLALFVVGLAVHSANATEMPLKMTLSDGGSMKIADCQGCGDDDDETASSCDIVCMVSFVATLASPADTVRRQAVGPYFWQTADDLTGRAGPPDPAPPRTLI